MKKPALTAVASSNIAAIGFADNGGLFVRFKGGQLYSYPDAPKKVHDDMLKSESVGSFFFREVRGRYVGLKMDA